MAENKKFYGSPIFVRDEKDRIFKIVELDLKPYRDFKILRVLDLDENEICRYHFKAPKDYTAISVSNTLEKISLEYLNAEGELIKRRSYNITVGDKIRAQFDPAVLKYERVLEHVVENMDQMDGSESEKENHTLQLHTCSYSPTAKTYVMTRIKTLIGQLDDVSSDEIDEYAVRIFGDQYGLGPIQELDEDPEVGEIMVNAREFPNWTCQIYYIKNQTKYEYKAKTFTDVNQLTNVLNRIIAFDNKSLNKVNNSIVEAIRPSGDRVNIVIPDASDNWSLNIRKFTNFVPDMQGMKRSGTVTGPIDRLFDVLVRGKANIGIGGMMGTGKTTMINFMLTYTPKDERKTIIAQVAETDIERVLKGHDVLIFKVNEEKNITFSKLLRTSLRTTSDRVIIPESRGSEFKELYEANTKTKGNMFTAHATDDASFMDVCVDMYMSSPDAADESAKYIKDKISKAIDIVVIMVRIGSFIRIKSISEVCMNDQGEFTHMSPLIRYRRDPEDINKGSYELTGTPMSSALCERLNELGVKMSEINKVNDELTGKIKLDDDGNIIEQVK